MAKQENRLKKPDWVCDGCLEAVPGRFKVCWNCGTTSDGDQSPVFQHADDYVSEIPNDDTIPLPNKTWMIFFSALLIFFVLLSSRMAGMVRIAVITTIVFGGIWLLLVTLAALTNRTILGMRRRHVEVIAEKSDPEKGHGIFWQE